MEQNTQEKHTTSPKSEISLEEKLVVFGYTFRNYGKNGIGYDRLGGTTAFVSLDELTKEGLVIEDLERFAEQCNTEGLLGGEMDMVIFKKRIDRLLATVKV